MTENELLKHAGDDVLKRIKWVNGLTHIGYLRRSEKPGKFDIALPTKQGQIVAIVLNDIVPDDVIAIESVLDG